MQRLEELLYEYEEYVDSDDNGLSHRLMDNVFTYSPSVSNGFVFADGKFVLINAHELFNRRRLRNRHIKFRSQRVAFDASSLQEGDFVVHSEYGIGNYEGLRIVKVQGQPRESLRIKYQEDVVLYVPLENFHMVEKYVGKEGFTPSISRIGTKDWERTKRKIKKSLQDISGELIRLYAQRKSSSGFVYPEDTHWQKEMENSFEFTETPDQALAIQDVKRDLESDYPMDRLLCGDVGFGKTEVAIRAAFKVVQENKQVALLVPTTILAAQHYETFSQRLSAFPVTIGVLSRFKSASEQKAIVKGLEDGSVDIVIGTHRLFSKDVKFKDLGLVIVDEEHRFGVKHKERLKSLKVNVDYLLMSATPIPRTLHMAMVGARDASQISTPIVDRLPIQTEIHPFSDDVIRYAILREVDRGGQVFFVHNRVESIVAIKGMLERIVPEVSYAIGHGQMKEKQLEQVMFDFMHQKYDVLISTMIIESGLDLPNVNTLIVNRADRFGLSQLYQLRGRIGRSSRQAYAVFLSPLNSHMTRDARLRLKTLASLTELGSGMKVAMRDMEIRGVGNLLGAEQSGHANAVGFDLYLKLLEEAVQELKGESKTKDRGLETKVEWKGSALLPKNYIEDGDLRYQFYRKLSKPLDIEMIDKMEEELIDRFGPLPQEAWNFINLMRIKCYGALVGMSTIQIGSQMLRAKLILPEDNSEAQRCLEKLVSAADPEQIEFSLDRDIQLIYRFNKRESISEGLRFLRHLTKNGNLHCCRKD